MEQFIYNIGLAFKCFEKVTYFNTKAIKHLNINL